MKTKSIIALIAAVCFSLVLIGGGCHRGRRAARGGAEVAGGSSADAKADANASEPQANLSFSTADEDSVDFAEKEEIRRKYTLKPESSIYLRGINGGVKIETADTNEAEVLIVRSAQSRDDLRYHKIRLEHDDDSLSIRVENDRKSLFSALGSIPEGRQRVVLKLPRQVALHVSGANGKVSLGEIQGRVGMGGVNGEIKAARISGEIEIHGVNGGIDLTLAPLAGNGIEFGGINGNIDLRFEGEVNAELNTWGINGQVNADLPNVQNKDNEEPGRGRFRARIGGGGSQIRVNGVNGNLHLMKAEKQAAATAKAAGR